MTITILPEGESLRHAVRWIAENRQWTLEAVQEASVMFDLTPLEEQFLLDQFVRHKGIGGDEEE